MLTLIFLATIPIIVQEDRRSIERWRHSYQEQKGKVACNYCYEDTEGDFKPQKC